MAQFVRFSIRELFVAKTFSGRKSCMKISRISDLSVVLLWLALAGPELLLPVSSQAAEETFNMLQIGSQTYQNVTVTTKSKNYIFILHSAGMTNIKVSDLPTDLIEKLGYAAPVPKVQTNAASVWAAQA